jgi:hypothetical protein
VRELAARVIIHPLADDSLQLAQIFVVARCDIRRLAHAGQQPLPILLSEEIGIAGAARDRAIGR